MSEEVHQLKRDLTMKITAEEGAAFLEKHGKVDEEAKTRAQQKQLDEADDETANKLNRTTTMAATAKEGEALLDGAELGKTRSETAKINDDETDEVADAEEKPQMQRAGTMQITAKEGAQILEANGGIVDGTRSESKQIEEAIKASEEEQNAETNGSTEEIATLKRKSTMMATAEEGEEFLKRQKVPDSEEASAKEVEA